MQQQVIINHITLQHLSFEWRITSILVALLLVLILSVATRIYWKRIFYKLTGHPDATQVFLRNTTLRYILRDLAFVFKLILALWIFTVSWQTFSHKPEITSITPAERSRLKTTTPEIELEFSVPVSQSSLEFHTSPEVKGEWIWRQPALGIPMYRSVKFVPEESFYPGTEVVIYLVGLRQIWYPWQSHEHAVAFSAPIIPAIRRTTPTTQSSDIATDTSVELEFNGPIGPYIDLNFEINPAVNIAEVVRKNNTATIKFEETLEQDQTYEITTYRTPRSYNALTGDDIQRGDTKQISKISFTTVASPLVNTYEPQGNSVLTDREIKVVFDQEMDQNSVVDGFSITPETPGEITWEDSRTFVFNPSSDLTKDTNYNVVFTSGLKSLAGGITEQEFRYEFRSIGPVAVASNTPLDNSSGINPNTQIRVNFNQEVDHSSAQEKFSISPPTSGDFRWEGNTLIFEPNDRLAYATNYSVKLEKGVRTVHGLDSDQEYQFSFSTKSNTFSLNIPWYRQSEGFTCNLAATRMVLAYRGIQFSESTIRDTIGIGQNPEVSWVHGYGTHISTIASFITPYRNVAVKTNWSVTELIQEIQNGNPVIIWEYNRYSQPVGPFTLPGDNVGYNGMHSEVVRGFIGDPQNPTHILTNDPWRGQLTYTRELFEFVWSYMNNTALVIY